MQKIMENVSVSKEELIGISFSTTEQGYDTVYLKRDQAEWIVEHLLEELGEKMTFTIEQCESLASRLENLRLKINEYYKEDITFDEAAEELFLRADQCGFGLGYMREEKEG